MLFDIDKFVSVPRNNGSWLVEHNGSCCTKAAAFIACGGKIDLVAQKTTDREINSRNIINWLWNEANKIPGFMKVLDDAESRHMNDKYDGEAVKMVIDFVLRSPDIQTKMTELAPANYREREKQDAERGMLV